MCNLTIIVIFIHLLFCISEEADAPSVWSQICIQNMGTLAKEATTVRRVLDPMFRYFDAKKHWSLERGLALVILQNMQFLMEQTGEYSPLSRSYDAHDPLYSILILITSFLI